MRTALPPRPLAARAPSRVVARPRRAPAAPHATAAPATAAPLTGPRPFDAGVPYTPAAWTFRGHACAYAVAGDTDATSPAVVLVHGFGASAGHWRKIIAPLTNAGFTVYAPDLLGFGASAKPRLAYTTPLWAEQVEAFVDEVVNDGGKKNRKVVLVGNSLGSLVAVLAAAARPASIAGIALLNIAGGMNNKASAAADDWRIKAARPLFALIDFLLSIPFVARALFDRFRDRDTLAGVLKSVYVNEAAVDDALVDLIAAPASDDGALDAFISIVTGDPGPGPQAALATVDAPLLFVWGDPDPFTPVDGPVGAWARGLPSSRPRTRFELLQGVGHCPQDDAPDKVEAVLVPWLVSECAQ